MFYYFSSLYERLSFLCRFNEFLLKFVLLCRFLENYKYTENMQGFYAILLLIVSNVFMTGFDGKANYIQFSRIGIGMVELAPVLLVLSDLDHRM